MTKQPSAQNQYPPQQLHQQFTLTIPFDEINLFEEITSDLVLSMWWDETGIVSGIVETKNIDDFIDRITPKTATITPLENRDWLEEEQLQLNPIDIGIFTLLSPHHKIIVKNRQTPLIIDSGHAFGSGHHETTRMCLMALQELRNQNLNIISSTEPNTKPTTEARTEPITVSNTGPGLKLNTDLTNHSNINKLNHPNTHLPLKALDLGCGSGVLAIAIAKLWGESSRVIASDCDESAVELTKKNQMSNHINNLTIIQAEGFDHQEIQKNGTYDLIVANIHSDPLIKLSKLVAKHLSPNGTVILSGILHEQEPQVIKAYQNAGLNLVQTMHENQWSSLIFSAGCQ